MLKQEAKHVVDELEQRRELLSGTITKLGEAAKPLAPSALTGDKVARREFDTLNAERAKAERDFIETETALEQARKQLAVAEASARNERDAAKRIEAARIARELLIESRNADEAAIALVAALRKRVDIGRALMKVGGLSSHAFNRMNSRGCINRMLDAFDLSDFSDIPRHIAARARLHTHDAGVLSGVVGVNDVPAKPRVERAPTRWPTPLTAV